MAVEHSPLDFLDLDASLSKEAISARDATRDWVAKTFLPNVTDHWRNCDFPREYFAALGELKAFGTSIEGWGCPGLDAFASGVIMRELERGDTGLRTCASVQGSLAMTAIASFGSEQQKNNLLPGMAAGTHISCFGLTEPEHGSNPGGMTTTARLDGDHYVLSGEKKWIGNATVADTAVIWAKADDVPGTEPTSSKAIRGFLVDTSLPGYVASLIEGRMSLRVGLTAQIKLADVRVPLDAMLPDALGLRGPLSCLDHARYGITWGAIGAAMACLEESLHYSRDRKIFDRPLASFQLTHDKLARMLTDLVQAQLVASRLATLKNAGTLQPAQISLGKVGNVDAAMRIARLSRELLGAIGICDDRASFRHLCNLESVATYEGTRDIHHLVLGQAMTGHSAFR
ncbi:MAG: acyl-CoA dehydrogenase family protein [Phycisphaerales bacterium]|nr:acyl-CoA dehydrogenase family protein [Phycisphaerales bacterium]